MRPCSAALLNFINSGSFLQSIQIDLYTFILTTGEVIRWSGGESGLTIPATGFPSGSVNVGGSQTFLLGPRFGRSKVNNKIGIAPNELDIDIFAGAKDSVGILTVANAARLGLFDGATVELDRLFAPPRVFGSSVVDTSLGVLVWFSGRVAEVEIGRSNIRMKAKSLMSLLAQQQMPRRVYGANCTHIFGDAMCGYDRTLGKNALGVSTGFGAQVITAGVGSTQSEIHDTGFVPAAPSQYIQGTIIGLSGANANERRTISNHLSGTVYFKKAWLATVSLGDTFTLLPGCDHTLAGGCTALQSTDRFGGFPYIPPAENAV